MSFKNKNGVSEEKVGTLLAKKSLKLIFKYCLKFIKVPWFMAFKRCLVLQNSNISHDHETKTELTTENEPYCLLY